MSALELITARATNPGTGAAGLAVVGNSLTIRAHNKGLAMLHSLWQTRAGEGNTQISSPLLHDNLVGMQIRGEIGLTRGMRLARQRVQSQDTLTVTLIGSAGAEEHSSYLIAYDELPGVDAMLIDAPELWKRGLNLTGVLNTITPGTTAFGTQVAINATNDALKANTDYALIGATFEDGVAVTGTHAMRWTSPDWGNLGIGMPANGLLQFAQEVTREFFLDLATFSGAACIPVFNSANKATTFLDAIGSAATATGVASMLVELAPASRGKR